MVESWKIYVLYLLVLLLQNKLTTAEKATTVSEKLDDTTVEDDGSDADSDDLLTRATGCGALDPTGKPPLTVEEYAKIRDFGYREEDKYRLGGPLRLNAREQKVNQVLMWFKQKEFDQGIVTNGDRILFPAGIHFYHGQKYINHSNVYKILRMMPKGGELHLHDLQSGSIEFNVELTKKMPNLYMCWDHDAVLRFQFFTNPTVTDFCETEWITVEQFRKNSSSEDFVDSIFFKKMSLMSETPEIDYPDNNAAWRVFSNTITTAGGLVGYHKATELYIYNLLQELYEDNIQYAEIRSLLEFFYRLDGPDLTTQESLEMFKRVSDKFVRKHPDFWGIRMIFSPIRKITVEEMTAKIRECIRLKKIYPEFLAGFDIVSHEDRGSPMYFYRKPLLEAAAAGLKFFFHAGETDWHGTRIDDNILDAILLNATRIGHGTAMNSRPYLVDLIRQKGIGVEMNPISSQILKLTSADMRTHPTIPFIRHGFPMTISSDNPGAFGTNNLSYDWYMTFMAMAGERADLRFLKQLAFNSIRYSAMCPGEKRRNLRRWQFKWNQFLKRVLIEFPNIPPRTQ